MLKESDLQNIADILRKDSLTMTFEAGSGHPTSCSSIAEIISVLFFDEMKYDINNPNNENNDELILSKGHAGPILYSALKHSGCLSNKEDLSTLRKLNSNLEGHPMPRSLPWIKVASGSLGQGLSIGVGMSLAAKLQKRNFRTFVILGDSECSEGSIYEALQLASFYKLNNLIAFVDINRLGQTGETMLGHNIKEYKKRFSNFNWNVLTCNGHNIKEIKDALKKSNQSKLPTIILSKTFKGKYFKNIENKNGWHGKVLDKETLNNVLKNLPIKDMPKLKIKTPSKINFKPLVYKLNNSNYEINNLISTREAYGNALKNLAISSKKIIVLDSEVSNSTYSEKVKEKTPSQFIECFIAEQNMIGVALGLQKKGFKTYSSSFASFLSRAHDQIRMSALSSPEGLTICGSHCGVSIGEDGVSQMGLEDISMFRSLPNSIVLYPSDAIQTEKLLYSTTNINNGIIYLRTTRGKTKIIYKETDTFPIGEFKILKQSNKDKCVVLGSGITLHEALKAYNESKEKNFAVIDIYSIKPFNHNKLIEFIKNHGNKLIIVEDHYKEGGIGEMILGGLTNKNTNSNIKTIHLAVNEIPHSGKPEELLKKYKIDSSAILESVNEI
jgi:transketolase